MAHVMNSGDGHTSYAKNSANQIPEGLENNKNEVYISMTSPQEVCEAYAKQYQRDLSMFLSSRGEEMVPNGRMVLTSIVRNTKDPRTERRDGHFLLFSDILLDMAAEAHLYAEEQKKLEVLTNVTRAYTEPLLQNHFGSSITDDLFARFKLKLVEYLSGPEPIGYGIIISLTKK